jgi:hypothetical protein
MDNFKENFSFTKEQFIEWTTEGFPLVFNEENKLEDFLVLFADYINKSENDFESFITDTFDEVFIKYDRTLVATVKYNFINRKVQILTSINEENSHLHREFSEFEIKKLLGDACLGFVLFCKGVDDVRSETLSQLNKKILNDIPKDIPPEKLFSSNQKFEPWPLS